MNDTELIHCYVDVDGGHAHDGPADVKLRKYGVPVWALVGQWKALAGDVDAVARDYQIPRQAVEAALVYYHRHKDLIDARLLLNTT